MHAHVNIWPLNAMGASSNNAIAREIGAGLRKEPGFRSYMLIRTSEQEVVAITVFDSQAQLQAALDRVEDLVHQRVTPLAAGIPQRRNGEVLYHTAAS